MALISCCGLHFLTLACILASAAASYRYGTTPQHLLAFQNRGWSRSQPQQSQSSSLALPEPTDDVEWQWIEEPELADPSFKAYQPEDDVVTTKPPRKLLWWGRMDDRSYHPSYRRTSNQPVPPTPHRLRMETWNITFSWRENRRKRDSLLSFEFHETGFVRCRHPEATWQQQQQQQQQQQTSNTTLSPKRQHSFFQFLLPWHSTPKNNDDDTTTYIVGTWRLAPSGVIWKMTWDEDRTYSFYADLHLNPFGKHPKMFRGMVLRDRRHRHRQFLRPLVATFCGKGKPFRMPPPGNRPASLGSAFSGP
jgi:hypothetical protein